MRKKNAVFPDINCRRGAERGVKTLTLSTRIRICVDGEYYLKKVESTFVDDEKTFEKNFSGFMNSVYVGMLMGKPDKSTTLAGESSFVKDSDTRTERQRILNDVLGIEELFQ